ALTRVYPDLTVDVLVVGRRGHRTATSAVLLERAAPRLAVIPGGPYNEEGRPHADVLERLEAAGVRVYRTDRDGTIQMTAAPRGPRVRLVPPQPPP
ncbi:MAG: MBL fold metallo-hydrolase, partial [Bacillota bacterium]